MFNYNLFTAVKVEQPSRDFVFKGDALFIGKEFDYLFRVEIAFEELYSGVIDKGVIQSGVSILGCTLWSWEVSSGLYGKILYNRVLCIS